MREYIMLACGIVFACGCFLWVYNAQKKCDLRGGTLVRGVFLYECVKR